MCLEIDVSLVGCPNPFVYPEIYKVNVPNPPPVPGAPARKAETVHTSEWRDFAELMDSSARREIITSRFESVRGSNRALL
jgi:hypothetical protein